MKFDLKCEKHARYMAKLPPRTTCDACWALWFLSTNQCYILQDDSHLVPTNK